MVRDSDVKAALDMARWWRRTETDMDARRTIEITDSTPVPVVPRRFAATSAPRPVIDRALAPGWRWFAALVGPVVAAICMSIEPPPAEPNAAVPLMATLLGVAYFAAMAGAAVTGLRGHPAALAWASVVALLAVAMTVTCPLSGHHTSIGAWWLGQFVVSGGALAIAVRGLKGLRSTAG